MSMKITEEEKKEIEERYRYLVNYGDDPDEPIDPLTYVDSNGDSLLHIAASNGDLKTIEILIRAGVDINKRGDMNCTALHYAKASGGADVVNFLLLHGADSSVRNDFGKFPGE